MMDERKQPKNLVEMFESAVENSPARPHMGIGDEGGQYTWITYKEMGQRVDACRAALAGLGIGAGDAVGIIAGNGPAWAVAAFAAYGLRARFVPMYAKELPATRKHIMMDAEVQVLFVATQELREEVEASREDLPSLRHVILIEGEGEHSMKALEEKGASASVPSQQPEPDEVAVLIYTSGTTGKPKGVLLSHGNFISNVFAAASYFPELNAETRTLAILPWAHSYGQTAELYLITSLGGSMGLVRSVSTIAEDMKIVRPTFMLTVPRVFNTIYDNVWNKMSEKGGLAEALFKMGLNAAEKLRAARDQGATEPFLSKIQYKIADKVVFRKVREGMGGRLWGALSGSAVMKLEVNHFFHDIGIPVYDCYGLSETTPAVTMNCPSANRPGTVGRPIPDVRVVIDKSMGATDGDEGEIIVYGPNVMKGYHNMPEATAAVMTEDGGFRTGDCGRLDEDGFLYITGRIKEQYKLENGKYVFPVALEGEIQLLHWVQNVLIHGEGKPYNICIVVPELDVLYEILQEKGLDVPREGMVTNRNVINAATVMIDEHLRGKFGGYEIPKRVILAAENFTVENGLLTQTMKLKRRAVLRKYDNEIRAAYG